MPGPKSVFHPLRRAFGGAWGDAWLFVALFVSVSWLTRVALAAITGRELGWGGSEVLSVLWRGLAFDLATAAWLALPLLLWRLALPARWYAGRANRQLARGVFLAACFALLFTAAAELVFWQEFGSRFNFIAVDYLIYTHEVIGNIRESYPLGAILGGLLAASAVLVRLLRPALRLADAGARLRPRRLTGAALLALPALTLPALGLLDRPFSDNRYAGEIAANGWYSLAAAFRANELDYERFYATAPRDQVLARLDALLQEGARPAPGLHRVGAATPERHLNVVLVSVESLSAEFLGSFGDRRGLTPNLDRLARDGLLFTRLYATGTRTVRGLEALSLSLPPTPGQSIVKRPRNADLFSLGSVFRDHGYDAKYIYGGYGYFDNMNAFFGANGYTVVDRTDVPQDAIAFENIWGIADENLFEQTLRELDASHAGGRPFFAHVMTTSNHRPFTYPDGRIDIPSHTGREGGVKYTDWAIGRFIEQARAKPWFEDTVFVIVADHCASSAGKTRLPVSRYHIPLIVYAPKHVAPGRVDTLASQIDVAPTLLGLLDFSYDSRFFGQDVLRIAPDQGRAFISTYQELGYLRGDRLTVLSPRKGMATYRVGLDDDSAQRLPLDPALRDEAIAYYQGASILYREGRYRALHEPPLRQAHAAL